MLEAYVYAPSICSLPINNNNKMAHTTPCSKSETLICWVGGGGFRIVKKTAKKYLGHSTWRHQNIIE